MPTGNRLLKQRLRHIFYYYIYISLTINDAKNSVGSLVQMTIGFAKSGARLLGHDRLPIMTTAEGRHGFMTEEEYYSGEFTDDFLNRQADAGEFYLKDKGCHCVRNEAEIENMTTKEYAMIFAQWIRANFQT